MVGRLRAWNRKTLHHPEVALSRRMCFCPRRCSKRRMMPNTSPTAPQAQPPTEPPTAPPTALQASPTALAKPAPEHLLLAVCRAVVVLAVTVPTEIFDVCMSPESCCDTLSTSRAALSSREMTEEHSVYSLEYCSQLPRTTAAQLLPVAEHDVAGTDFSSCAACRSSHSRSSSRPYTSS